MILRFMAMSLSIILGAAQVAHARGTDPWDGFRIADAASVDEAVAEVSSRLKRQGFDVVGVIDHAAAAASVDLDLAPTQLLLFRSARLDRRLIRRSQTAAIDLPMKMLIFENDAGEIEHKYNGPGYLVDRHGIFVTDPLVIRQDLALRQFGDPDNGLVTVPGRRSVEDTVAVLKQDLADAGFRIPIVLDYTEGARRPLRDTTLIIFGNPLVGTQLMQNAREVGLDLPQKFLVFEGRDGDTRISYNDPRFVARRAGVQGLDMLLDNIADALARFAAQASR